LTLADAELQAVIDALVAGGRVGRRGHRVWLRGQRPEVDPETRQRVDQLLAGLRETGAAPPRVDGLAARLGITPMVLAGLRRSGELVSVAPGIDYPADVWAAIVERLDRMSGPANVARVRDELRTSRRHAEAILARRRADRASRRGPATRRHRPRS
jgi:hypothetical protein